MEQFYNVLIGYGPWGMFLSAFLAGSVIPFSSEVVLLALWLLVPILGGCSLPLLQAIRWVVSPVTVLVAWLRPSGCSASFASRMSKCSVPKSWSLVGAL